jgi:hypothetical protein
LFGFDFHILAHGLANDTTQLGRLLGSLALEDWSEVLGILALGEFDFEIVDITRHIHA